MLYVSGISNTLVEITDSDDNSIEQCKKFEVFHLVKMGINIEGVNVLTKEIRVYNPNRGAKENKLLTLKGIKLTVIDGVLHGIDIVKSEVKYCLELSKYCNEIGYDGLRVGYRSDSVLCIVLDNKIKYNWGSSGILTVCTNVLYDIRKLSNRNANSFYNKYDNLMESSWNNVIYDSDKDRFLRALAIRTLENKYILDVTQYIFSNFNCFANRKNLPIWKYRDYVRSHNKNKLYKQASKILEFDIFYNSRLFSVCSRGYDNEIRAHVFLTTAMSSMFKRDVADIFNFSLYFWDFDDDLCIMFAENIKQAVIKYSSK